MHEIRFHSRGGQGGVVGSEVLAQAFFLEGKFVQAFPAFGVERRGAPVLAFCRSADHPILLRNNIYEPDHVVVLDFSLLQTTDITKGLKEGGTVLINGKKHPEHYQRIIGEQWPIYVVDAGAIAYNEGLGSPTNPIVNTAILGAFSRVTGLVGIDAVSEAICAFVPAKREENAKAARIAFEQVRGMQPCR